MKKILLSLAAITLLSVCFTEIGAQTKNDKPAAEITALRQKLTTAIEERNRKTLEEIYAGDFTHTHASGQVDDKAKRLTALLSGEPTIESAEVVEINIRSYGKTTAVAVGQSTVQNKDGSSAKYRWTTVYCKTKNTWQIVASQATRLAEK